MLKTSRLAALAMLGVMAASPAYAENKPAENKPAVSIPQERVDLRVKMVTTQQQGQADTPELRKAIRDDLVNIELMSREALKNGLDKQPEVVQQLELAKQTVLVGAFVQDFVKSHPVGDEVVTKEYDNLKAHLGKQEYHVNHILVEKESEAKALAEKLKKGGKNNTFDKLAKASSKDTGSKEHNGDLGWIPIGDIPTSFVKPFGDALLKLTKGQVSDPVQSQFGWHIIRLEDVRDLKLPSMEELKPQLVQRLQQQSVKQLITDLRDKVKVE
jgi:peptidyl-prolyl cis-trans isomerase C